MKLPAMQFYPGDWWRDLGVLSLSCEERGAWFQLLLLMHDSEKRGILLINGKPPTDQMLSNVLALEISRVREVLDKIVSKGVASVDQNTGALICRRMLHLHKIRSIAGHLSRTKFKAKSTQVMGPSISTSISTSTSKPKTQSPKSSFAKPSTDDVRKVFLAKGSNSLEADKFFNYYESNGWKVGKNPMKNWMAAAAGWISRNGMTASKAAVQFKDCFVCSAKKIPLDEWESHFKKHQAQRSSTQGPAQVGSVIKQIQEKTGPAGEEIKLT